MAITKEELMLELGISEEDFEKTLWALNLPKNLESLDSQQEESFRIVRGYFTEQRVKNYKEAAQLYRLKTKGLSEDENAPEMEPSNLATVIVQAAEATADQVIDSIHDQSLSSIREAREAFNYVFEQHLQTRLGAGVLEAEILDFDGKNLQASPLGLLEEVRLIQGQRAQQKALPGM
jgi:hypothetical protein